ncbi:Hpt domain-containing protein [Litoribaculum gwangyangense]|uniref:Hpt domain-containing protein n=1 Tax=Litoribaculum gwangyangense TaxID=1130722 RepID=A0ABP9CMV3_9FLAO
METPNLSYITSMSGGNLEFENKIITIIKEEFPTEKEEFFNNLNKYNFKLAAGNVHKLKHKISILGLEKSYGIAVAFENNLLEGNSDLSKEFESILNTITNYLKQL